MLITTVVASLALSAGPVGAVDALAGPQAVQPVKIWLSKERGLRRGDRIRVYVRAEVDGYVAVFHAEPDGRIRMLFPLDPFADNFLRGGRDYELEGRGGREAFTVYESDGVGAVFAMFSRDPLRLDQLARGDHWDYRDRDRWVVYEDAETDLSDLALLVAGGASYDYDLVRYDAGARVAYRPYRSYYDYGYDPYYYGSSRLFIGFGFGHRHYRYSAFSCYDAFYYDPFYCDPFYSPYGYYRPAYYYYQPYYYYRPYRYYRPYGYRTVYVGGYGHRDHSLRLNRYTFKSDHGSGLADGGLAVRQRTPPTNAVGRVTVGQPAGSPIGRATARDGNTIVRARQPAAPSSRAGEGRRAAPERGRDLQTEPATRRRLDAAPAEGRRVAPERGRDVRTEPATRRRLDAAPAEGRRVAPERGRDVRTEPATRRRLDAAPAESRRVVPERSRGVAPRGEARSAREVRPEGRVPSRAEARPPTEPRGTSRAAPQRSVTPRQPASPQNRAVPERRARPEGAVRPQRRSNSRRATPQRAPQLERRSPSRSARPQASPRLDRRSPRPSARSGSPPRIQRSAPNRVQRGTPGRIQRSAPNRVQRGTPGRIQRSAPARIQRSAPRSPTRRVTPRAPTRTPPRPARRSPTRKR